MWLGNDFIKLAIFHKRTSHISFIHAWVLYFEKTEFAADLLNYNHSSLSAAAFKLLMLIKRLYYSDSYRKNKNFSKVVYSFQTYILLVFWGPFWIFQKVFSMK